MTVIDFHASERQYLQHLAPVYHATPLRNRGTFRVALGMEGYAQLHGIEPSDAEQGDVVLVAGWRDAHQGRARQIVLMEHGVGQTYEGRTPHYAGGVGREHIALFLAPNERVLRANQEATPSSEHALVGSPRMDRWFSGRYPIGATVGGTPIVTFHWDADVCNEAHSGFRFFRQGVIDVAAERPIFAHYHPKALDHAMWWAANGIAVVHDFDDVMTVGSVLCVDNSSAMFEFAATDRPVVVLNPPDYRRDVNHGLRFWEMADVGVQCQDPDLLSEAIDTALSDPATIARRRREITAELFPIRDGTSAALAVDAILSLT